MGVVCRVSIASIVLSLALLILSARPAAAGEPWSDPSLMVISIGTAGLPSAAIASPSLRVLPRTAVPVATSRPTVLVPLYLSFAALQGLDAFTTVRALERGAVEANPLLGGVAGNRAALVATKVGMTAATVWLTERLWRRNTSAAIVVMSLLNGVYAAVVAHNWQAVR